MIEAMIFSAGLGTRLKPITDHLPKALVEVNKITVLERVIKRLKSFGVQKIIVNVHHYEDLIIDFLKNKNYFDLDIKISIEVDILLDTGGGLKYAEKYFSKEYPILLHNVDIVSNINLNKLYENYQTNNSLVTLAVQNRKSDRYFIFNSEYNLCGYGNLNCEEIMDKNKIGDEFYRLGFTGIHIISPEIFNKIIQNGSFSIRDIYLNLAKNGEIIKGVLCDESYWFDIGSISKLNETNTFMKKNNF